MSELPELPENAHGRCDNCGRPVFKDANEESTHFNPKLKEYISRPVVDIRAGATVFNSRYLDEDHRAITEEESNDLARGLQELSPNHPSLQNANVNNVISMQEFRNAKKNQK
jgi:hypothetical protein